jgi:hypothetical protein
MPLLNARPRRAASFRGLGRSAKSLCRKIFAFPDAGLADAARIKPSFDIFVDKTFRSRHRGGFPPFAAGLCGSDVTLRRAALPAGTFRNCRSVRSMIHF